MYFLFGLVLLVYLINLFTIVMFNKKNLYDIHRDLTTQGFESLLGTNQY